MMTAPVPQRIKLVPFLTNEYMSPARTVYVNPSEVSSAWVEDGEAKIMLRNGRQLTHDCCNDGRGTALRTSDHDKFAVEWLENWLANAGITRLP